MCVCVHSGHSCLQPLSWFLTTMPTTTMTCGGWSGRRRRRPAVAFRPLSRPVPAAGAARRAGAPKRSTTRAAVFATHQRTARCTRTTSAAAGPSRRRRASRDMYALLLQPSHPFVLVAATVPPRPVPQAALENDHSHAGHSIRADQTRQLTPLSIESTTYSIGLTPNCLILEVMYSVYVSYNIVSNLKSPLHEPLYPMLCGERNLTPRFYSFSLRVLADDIPINFFKC